MDSSLAKVVVSVFEKRLEEVLPQFESISDQEIASVCRLYGSTIDKITFFVLLQMHRHEDSFTVEVGWSKSQKWPETFLVSPVTPEQAEGKREARFRLGRLWVDEDVWWDVRPGLVKKLFKDSSSCVETQVADAMAHLIRDGMSYFNLIAKRLGVLFQKHWDEKTQG
jgi:hypothetical protein